jgi:hypothetical protein
MKKKAIMYGLISVSILEGKSFERMNIVWCLGKKRPHTEKVVIYQYCIYILIVWENSTYPQNTSEEKNTKSPKLIKEIYLLNPQEY